MADLNGLIRTRSVTKSALTRFENYVAKFIENNGSMGELKARQARAQLLLNEFEEVQLKIELIDGDSNYEQDRVAFEERFYRIMSECERLLERENITTELDTRISESATNAITDDFIRLPTLNLQTYDGSYENWQSFKDTFEATIFYELILDGQIKLDTITLRESHFGWLVTGTLPTVNHVTCHQTFHNVNNIEISVEKWWEMDDAGEETDFSLEELECEKSFKDSTRRNKDGRFIVKYPTDHDFVLGDSLSMAIKRFRNLERRLEENPTLKTEYCQFLQEYEDADHMSRVDELREETLMPIKDDLKGEAYYIPHHAVHKMDSSTTKIRVVFDASAKSSNGLSLNDILMNGPVIQSELFALLLRFREYNIVLSADVKQMFRQVLVSEEQREWQRILWRKNMNDKIGIFKLNTVTYGLKPATYLTTRCINAIASEFKEVNPMASDLILKNMYVDDITFGANNMPEALKLKTEISDILENRCFELRKWRSNCSQLLNDSGHSKLNDKHFIKDSSEIKTLGLVWDSQEDVLKFSINLHLNSNNKLTKRMALSLISRIFDPLGIVGPITVKAKLFMQGLWSLSLAWDDPLPGTMQNAFAELTEDLKQISSIAIPRNTIAQNCTLLEIHGFCDASLKAYGAAIYLRSKDHSDNVKMELLCSKSRVAPLKKCTLPRLELCGAVLLATLVKVVSEELSSRVARICLWTDSSIVVYWIRSDYKKFKPFVANRIQRIQSLTKCEMWNHIAGTDNPADILSRGASASNLKLSTWFTGPHWFKMNELNWPNTAVKISDDNELCEVKRISMISLLCSDSRFDVLEKFSNLRTLIRVIAWCRRFVNKCNKSIKVNAPSLTADEVTDAFDVVLKLIQWGDFRQEIECLTKYGTINKGKLGDA
ncbi:uncharacterized protein [Onthophagus taurus]|uniref:uncharacterized protein n=1 Tax=Onthophagus taurus TaxID=166361 RepID=UPI0039BEAF8C